MQVQFLDQEDLLQKEVTTYSSILDLEVPWTEEPGILPSMGLQKSWTWLSDETTKNMSTQVPYGFNYYNSVIYFEIKKCDTSGFVSSF